MAASPNAQLQISPDDGRGISAPAGRYRLLAEVARGSSSVVYHGEDAQLGREVAVKVFHLSPADAEQLARQQAELRTLASLNHPGIVTLFDSGTDFSQPDRPRGFLVMEHVGGEDLRKLLDGGPLSTRVITELAIDILGAMLYMHELGVIHRDIKPANILLVPDSHGGRMRAKLSDFGTALTPGGAIGDDFSSGTAAYMSPEQVSGAPVQGSSDVYSLGLVLLECFTGVLAFPGSAMPAMVARLESPPAIPDTLDLEWRELLIAMTERAAENRPTVASLMGLLSGTPAAGNGRHRIHAHFPTEQLSEGAAGVLPAGD